MAAFLSSFLLGLGILFTFSGLSMDKFVDWVNYSYNDYMLQISVEQDPKIMKVPYNNCESDTPTNEFGLCDRQHRWLKIHASN
jgi:hypothetical protein